MISSIGYAAQKAKQKLSFFEFQRRDLKSNDVLIKIKFCGVCHSDIHQARDEWGKSSFPMVPGHEVVGVVEKVGDDVKKFKPGDIVGVGCMVDSCMKCASCEQDLEQYCEVGNVPTYNGREYDSQKLTYGGYSNNIVVREEFVLKIPENLDLAAAAPLLCAGITTYSPLKHWKISKGHKLGVVGLGGLGHMAVKLAKAFGAHVLVFTTSASKIEDAKRLGADEVVLSTDEALMESYLGKLDFILDTVAATHNLSALQNCLKIDGQMIMVGLPDQPYPEFEIAPLIFKRRSLSGSLIGGIKETQEMLNFCGQHNIVCDIEKIQIQEINEAYEKTIKGQVKYRFVIDMESLQYASG